MKKEKNGDQVCMDRGIVCSKEKGAVNKTLSEWYRSL